MINRLYTNQWSLIQNHFRPTLKLAEKKRINSKYYKKYETPKTPYQRLMLSEYIPDKDKITLENLHLTLDPFKIKRQINRQLKEIFRMVTVTTNVRKRL